ncbi:lysis protein [Cronobacter sakazakii]|uniref:lysis protein n=1 Tax=Cronobacter sakazakii TaxID=28141 RepID=UPI0013BD83B6|nr:lysis protein [Cronobacter sakazakii]ELY4431867.1 lysis protein [Cronobacter sakazakii]ELY4453617.1 lysis protein [Cronobacter sakazakii]KAB1488097.1 lysis protein [Cronobacter sakazakii]
MLTRLLGLLALIAILTSFYYHDQFKESQASLTTVNRELNAVKDTKKKMLESRRKLAELDAWYTGEIARVKAENDQLRADVANGTRRLQLHANCERVRNATGATGGADATAPRLDDAAQRDYFDLQKRIKLTESQIFGLQKYIKENCLK